MLLLWKALNGWRGNNVPSPYSMNFQLLQKLSKTEGHVFPLKLTPYKLGRDCIQIPTEHRPSDGMYAVCFKTISQPLLLRKLFFDQEIRFSDKASTLTERKQELFTDRDWYFLFFSIYRTMRCFCQSTIYEWSNASTEYFRLLKDPGSWNWSIIITRCGDTPKLFHSHNSRFK